jgi:23S rRNA pseudouridine2605 synthase
MRLAKYLASCGIASRRRCEEFIQSGHVRIDGEIISNVATNVTGAEKIQVDDRTVKPNHLVYYLLNKPAGYTCSLFDPHALKLASELVPNDPPVWPVGRLDRDTSGLIIFTNDGELTNKLTHPKYQKEKEYLLTVDRPLSAFEIEKMKKGIELEDGRFVPDKFVEVSPGKYTMIVHEGRNRLIRRSVEYFGKQIMHLERTRIGKVTLSNLASGNHRVLSKSEVAGLYNA